MAATAAAASRDEAMASVRESRVSTRRPAHGASNTVGRVDSNRYAVTAQTPALPVSADCRCSITETTTAPYPTAATNRAVPASRKSRLRSSGAGRTTTKF